jgi:hypothetical protein
MPGVILIDVEPVTSHVSLELSPALMETGLALNVVIIGTLDVVTVTVADAVELPASLEAVSVYAVVDPGVTFCDPVGDTVPISGLMETDVASVTLHDNVADWPAKILAVLKLKLLIVGAGALTVIVLDPLVVPKKLLAARVYVVVVPGETVLVPMDGTVPTPGLMETDVAPVTFHCNTAD